jgi:hypothetical protein
MFRLFRRWFRRGRLFVAMWWGWNHRGTVMRLMDAARNLPVRARSDRLRDSVAELRAIAELDRDSQLARRADVRIGGVSAGSVTLLAPSDREGERARSLILGVPGVIDVRAVDPTDPPLASSPAPDTTTPTTTPRVVVDAAGR